MAENFWSRYKEVLNPRTDFRDLFIRPHTRHATLDGVRAITVLLMVLFHVLFGIVVLFDENFERLDNFITSFPRYLGWMWQAQGSDPLFMVCGLLVSYTLFKEYDRTSSIQLGRFYRRRIMRILPVFLLALLIYLPTDKDLIKYLWSNLIFMSNYVEGHRHITPVGWSLDVQMHFYFLLPFFVLLMYRMPSRVGYLVALILASFAWRYYIVARNPEIYESPFYRIIYDSDYGSLLANQLYYDLDVRIGAFFLGMLVAYLHHYYKEHIKAFLSRHMVINSALLLLGIATVVLTLSLPIENKEAAFYDNFDPQFNLLFLAFDRYLYTVALSLLVLLALCPAGWTRWLEWFLSWRIWHPVAQLIFPIYLFHFVFLVIAAVLTFWTTDRDSIVTVATWQVFAMFFICVALTMAFSSVVHVYIEKPFLTMRDRRKADAPSPAPEPAVAGNRG